MCSGICNERDREGEMSNHVNEEAPGNQLWHLEWLRVNPLSPRLQKDSRAGTGQGAVKEVGEQAAEQASEGGQCKLLTGNLLTLHWPRAESSLHLTKAHNALPWTRPSADPFTLLCMCVCCVCWCVCGWPIKNITWLNLCGPLQILSRLTQPSPFIEPNSLDTRAHA